MANENYDVQADLEFCEEYLKGEEILWTGRPEPVESDETDTKFTIILCVIAAVIMLFYRTTTAYIIGGIFILIALFAGGGKDVDTNARREKTFYIISNRKIIRKYMDKIDFVHLSYKHDMEVIMHKNGNGTIKFLDSLATEPYTYFRKETESRCFFQLENIRDVRKVEKIISDLLE